MNHSIPARSFTAPKTMGLHAIGSIGAVLAFTILGASILLRLTTTFATDGATLSLLPSAIEDATRLVHRLAAAGLGVLALVAAVLCVMQRSRLPQAVKPVAWMVACTVLLAVIGPLTPGYRYHTVTITNVMAGTVLLMACWWLRVALVSALPKAKSMQPMVRGTMVLLVVHVGLGAAASAFAARGTHWVSFVHSGSAMLTLMLVGSIVWDRRGVDRLRIPVLFTAGLLVFQLVLGVSALWADGRPVWLGFVHAMLSPLLAAGLVTIVASDD
ncbi:MAG: hypothetical protein IPG23_08170 [Burkholderiales bacterium]|nr:hypothetical protein [Burkholderiales bacterium]